MSALPSHLELVQGVVLPKPVGAHPVLDFVNTRSEWTTRGPARTEWLTSYEAFLIWCAYAGLKHGADGDGELQPVLDFRSDLYDVLTGQATDHTFASAARLIEKATARRLVRTDGRPVWELPEDPLYVVALRAGELLTGPSFVHVRTCPSCGWLFLDPRGRRRWCSMATCGNRAKVRAHAARAR